jgi:hypothetical protein
VLVYVRTRISACTCVLKGPAGASFAFLRAVRAQTQMKVHETAQDAAWVAALNAMYKKVSLVRSSDAAMCLMFA